MDDSSTLKKNYLYFCAFYSLVHAAVDSVLAFAVAELGTKVGSLGGSVLYIFYTASTLFLAKPCVQFLEAKTTVFLGLVGTLFYVAGFFLAILIPSAASVIFLIGCSVGGIGAGLLWTGQGSYYTLNATYYAAAGNHNATESVTNFAAIFAGFYLSFETAFKFMGTLIFVVVGLSSSVAIRPILFGLYTASAFISTILFWFYTRSFSEAGGTLADEGFHGSRDDTTRTQRRRLLSTSTSLKKQHKNAVPDSPGQDDMIDDEPPTAKVPITLRSVCLDFLAVGWAMCSVYKLQLLIPFQICFGLSSRLVDTYVNGVVVKKYMGEGNIGFLSGLITLSAALLAGPFAVVGNYSEGQGKGTIMIFGALCFALNAIMLIVLSDRQLAAWPVIVFYYIIHGAARGVWENTNKVIISEYFATKSMRDSAFAAVYFSSGLAGAVGFALFQFLGKYEIALINVASAGLALFCFMIARRLHNREARATEIRHMVAVLSDSPSSSDSDEDDTRNTRDIGRTSHSLLHSVDKNSRRRPPPPISADSDIHPETVYGRI